MICRYIQRRYHEDYSYARVATSNSPIVPLLTSAPCSCTSHCTTLRCPFLAAQCNGVRPSHCMHEYWLRLSLNLETYLMLFLIIDIYLLSLVNRHIAFTTKELTELQVTTASCPMHNRGAMPIASFTNVWPSLLCNNFAKVRYRTSLS